MTESFYQKIGKRAFDLVAASIGLVILSPFFVLVALLIKIEDGGAVFFRQRRVGRNFRLFSLIKFRSMSENSRGSLLTVKGDPRITRVGRILRYYKIDEFPQLFNVLRGEMSLVGPRPEVEKYVMYYKEMYGDLLRFRPGITDPASLVFSREEELLSQKEDWENYYIRELLPKKIQISLTYARRATFFSDLKIIFQTLGF